MRILQVALALLAFVLLAPMALAPVPIATCLACPSVALFLGALLEIVRWSRGKPPGAFAGAAVVVLVLLPLDAISVFALQGRAQRDMAAEATRIQAACAAQAGCPETPEGWTGDRKDVGLLGLYPVTYLRATSGTAFTLVLAHGLDAPRFVAHGAVASPVSTELQDDLE